MQGVYERHAVIFRSQNVPKSVPRSLASGGAANGYRVKSRSNSCRGILGRSSNKIIHMSIDRKTDEEEEEIDKLSYDKILHSYRSGQEEEDKTVSSESTVPLFPSVDSESRELLFSEQRDPDVHKTVVFEHGNAGKTWASRPISVPSGRPTTALSRLSSYDLESDVWTIGGTCCRTPSSLCDARGVSGRSQRSISAHSQQKARSSIQKSVTSSVPSISSHPQNGTSEYIQFAHKMKVPKEFAPTKSRTQTKTQPRVRSPTHADAQLRTGKIMRLQAKIPPPAPPTSVQDTTTISSEAEKQLSSTLLVVEEKPSSPVDAPVVITPDTKYAFNIPTAELVAESENNSLDDAEEFAMNSLTESESDDEDRREGDIEEMATKLVDYVLAQLQNDSEETWTSTTFITAN